MSSRFAPILLVFVIACGGKQKPAPAAPPANAPVAEPATPPPAEPATPPPPSNGERPASVTDEMVAVAEDMVVAMEAMGKELTAAGTDCHKGSVAVHNGMAALRPIAARAKPFKDINDPAAEEWFKQRYMSRMMNAMSGLMGLAQSCGSDKEFMDAMNEMGQLDV
jgi:hypothetical protein